MVGLRFLHGITPRNRWRRMPISEPFDEMTRILTLEQCLCAAFVHSTCPWPPEMCPEEVLCYLNSSLTKFASKSLELRSQEQPPFLLEPLSNPLRRQGGYSSIFFSRSFPIADMLWYKAFLAAASLLSCIQAAPVDTKGLIFHGRYWWEGL